MFSFLKKNNDSGKRNEIVKKLKKRYGTDCQFINRIEYEENNLIVLICDYNPLIQINIFHVSSNSVSTLKAVYYEEEKKIHICDIICYSNNKGFGSILMKELINYAVGLKCKLVSGYLAKVDIDDHKDRLFHFYNKFGFKIVEKKDAGNLIYDITLQLT